MSKRFYATILLYKNNMTTSIIVEADDEKQAREKMMKGGFENIASLLKSVSTVPAAREIRVIIEVPEYMSTDDAFDWGVLKEMGDLYGSSYFNPKGLSPEKIEARYKKIPKEVGTI